LKVKVTTTIDAELKHVFETILSREFTLGGLLEQAILERLEESDPLAALQVRREILARELEGLDRAIEDISAGRQKRLEEAERARVEELSLEQYRRSLLSDPGKRHSVELLWHRRDLNWKVVVERYRFKSRREAEAWFREFFGPPDYSRVKELREEGRILGGGR